MRQLPARAGRPAPPRRERSVPTELAPSDPALWPDHQGRLLCQRCGRGLEMHLRRLAKVGAHPEHLAA
jgi:hypothetical protein